MSPIDEKKMIYNELIECEVNLALNLSFANF